MKSEICEGRKEHMKTPAVRRWWRCVLAVIGACCGGGLNVPQASFRVFAPCVGWIGNLGICFQSAKASKARSY